MNFEFTMSGVIQVQDYEFEEMERLVKNGYTYERAFADMITEWNNIDYYNAQYIKDVVIDELKRRMKNESNWNCSEN